MYIPKNSILKSRYDKEKQLWLLDIDYTCSSCGQGTRSLDCSHIISRNECLQYGLYIMPNGQPLYTLYYSMINFRPHCNDFLNSCHRKFENGDFLGNDYEQNRAFVESHAPVELYQKFLNRFEHLLS